MSKETAIAIAAGATPPPAVIESATPPAEGEGAAPKDDLVSSRIAMIAKKEAKYQAEQENLKKELDAFTKRKQEFDPFYDRYKKFEETREKDPVEAIRMLGFTDTDFINYMATQEDKSTPEEKAAKIVATELDKFKREQAEKETKSEQQRHAETISGFKKNIDIALKTNAEKYEFCNFYGEAAQELIFQTVDEGFKNDVKTNPDAVPMSPEEAAELVEAYYAEQFENMGKLKKAKPPEAVVEEVKDVPLKASVLGTPPPKTLTNKIAAPAATGTKRETPSEKRERLIAALRNGGR